MNSSSRRNRRCSSTRNALLISAAVTAASAGAAVAGYGIYRRLRTRESLAGKVVLITGGSRGLGLALAQEFASRGALIAICARDAEELQSAKALLSSGGGRVFTKVCDVSVQDEVVELVNAVTEHFGRIDVLVNNAGIITVGPLESQTLTEFQEAMDIMYWGTVYPSLAALPQMRSRGRGNIVNVTSIGGKVSVPHLLPYCGAKFAAVGFSEGLRSETAKDGIEVTTIVPGLMRTGSHQRASFKGKHEKEYTWFALGAALPGVSIGARRAARKIVSAVQLGKAEVVLTPQAKLMTRFHGVFPAVTARIFGVVNRMLPSAEGDPRQRWLGRESKTAVTQSFLTKLGRDAARELNQQSGREGRVKAS